MQDIQPKKQPPLPEPPKEVKEPYFVSGTKWMWGFNPSAEIWNGRLAMIGFLAAALIEITTGHGFLHFWGFLTNSSVVPPQF